jgi:hypothetical protein
MPGYIQNVTLKLKTQKLKTNRLKKETFVIADPEAIPDRKIGDKLRFDSKDGKIEVKFDRWIFPGKGPNKGPFISDNRPRTLRRRGYYKAYCYITTTAGEQYGYKPASTASSTSSAGGEDDEGGAHGNVG